MLKSSVFLAGVVCGLVGVWVYHNGIPGIPDLPTK